MYIGIIGGVGPYAGVDLFQKILNLSKAKEDQEYPSVLLASIPNEIPDRSEFILGITNQNPAYAIYSQIETLYNAGARLFGIACNTAHAMPIWNIIQKKTGLLNEAIMINMVACSIETILSQNSRARIGLLATMGTYKAKVFQTYGEKIGANIYVPFSEESQYRIHDSIYNKQYGIKSLGILSSKSNQIIKQEISQLKKKFNIDHLILGCTELSIVFKDNSYDDLKLIKTLDVLAAALLKKYNDKKK